jgi:23S rRNA (pseudouridine1915-N3)-methyltransferase
VKIQVIRTGKLSQTSLVPLVNEYRKRLTSFVKVDDLEIKADAKRDKRNASKSRDPIYLPEPGEFLVLLDERGRALDSATFAGHITQWMDDPSIKTVTFLIGPPYGFDDATRAAAKFTWSLSSLTMPSDLAWLMCWEQVYRAFTIIKGMPYHHD